MNTEHRVGALRMVAAVLAWAVVCGASAGEEAGRGGSAMNEHAMKLVTVGAARQLAPDLFGMNAPTALYEYVVEDAAKVAPVKELAPALLRFPGGTIANYYQWRSGQIEVPLFPDSSMYTRIMNRTGTNIAKRLRPGGMSLDRFAEFARATNAGVLLVPNLETSSVEEQVAWFRHLHERGLVPRYIEMGNEFWVAMLMDPNVIRKFPDARTTMKLIKEYVDALGPYLPEDARIAVQSAGSEMQTTQGGGGRRPLIERMRKWDADMEDAPWFHALTVRLYPEIDQIYGPGAYDGLPGNVDAVYPALLTHVDEGLDHMFRALTSRFPGKEIWVSEWSANGTSFFFLRRNPGLKGMMIQATIRTYLTFMRAPEVTISTMHMLSFTGGPWALFTAADDGGFRTVGPALAMTWFHHAANGGATYQRAVAEGGPRIEGTGAASALSCNAVEGALLSTADATVLLVQNAGREPVTVDLADLGPPGPAERIDMLATPDLMEDFSQGDPNVQSVPVASQILLEPYSLTRVVWRAR